MIYIHLAKAFAPSPYVHLPPDTENYFRSIEQCAEHATPAEPAIWSARLLNRFDDGSRVVRLLRFKGHAMDIGTYAPMLPAPPEPPLMLAGMA